MDADVVPQFFDFFQNFILLCQAENWPNNNTTDTEIENALLISEHIEKCLNNFLRKNILNDFLTNLTNNQDMHNLLLKTCFADPPKHILKKIINSKTKINLMDVAFKCFVEIFSEEKLEECLTDIMLETASKQTLLKNLSQEIPQEKILIFKSQLLLFAIHNNQDNTAWFEPLFNNCTQDIIDLIVIATVNKEVEHHDSVCMIVKLLIDVTKSKSSNHKKFWNFLFNVEERYFIEMCLIHQGWFRFIVKALLDCGKLLQEHMSAEYFYIDLTYSELASNFRKICTNDNLKVEVLDIIHECDANVKFWENMLL